MERTGTVRTLSQESTERLEHLLVRSIYDGDEFIFGDAPSAKIGGVGSDATRRPEA
jgi:hypothetical protein